MTVDSERIGPDEAMNLIDAWVVIWRDKWIVAAAILIGVGISVIYILTAQEWYQAEVLLKPVDTRSNQGLSSELGGALASIVGIDVTASISAEPIAVLKSREFNGAFIADLNLLPILFARKWDASNKRWKSSDVADQPDVRDGINYFDKNVRKVQEDKKSALVPLTIEWKDAATAANWANVIVERVNDLMRNRALATAEYNVTYLKQELAASSVVTMQQSIGRVLESELQKLVIAKGNKEFAFRIIDHAQIPKYRVWPQRVLIVSGAFLVSLALSVFFLLSRSAIRRNRLSATIPKASGSQ